MDLNLPERTACEVEWRDGVRLWLKTLNVWERDESAESADLWAHAQTRRYRGPDGEGYQLLFDRFSSQSVADLCLYLAESGLLDGSLAASAVERAPDPERPGPTWVTPADSSAYLAWEEGCRAAVARREALIRAGYDAAIAAAEGMDPAARIEACCLEAWARRLRQVRGFRLVCETLYRAVRLEADRSRHFFADVGAVMELDDVERDALWSCYEGMQLPAAAVPTWAAVSQA